MKYSPNKTENKIATFLLVLVGLLLGVILVNVLESEALVHGEVASDWYMSVLQSISFINSNYVHIP